ncbi:Lysophospholipase L1 [Oceanobacillus limi]|uniref:Lysophospholipase L1 n=1 Tax=Oceanobacillus limi TaxID=930131 RepID=A0A1I0F1X3_9BACI|nr:SGNH/GDSL hydrolase family protein [Oceanobacillus limi]SET51876.1 Lysophospholipase L1 [Oceanobacillus limi]
MKRKLIIFTILLVLICSGIFLYILNDKPRSTLTINKPDRPTENREDEETIAEEAEEQIEELNEESTEESNNNLGEFISEAVESTIDFFKHEETNIVAIGDSLTQGVGDDTNQGGYVGIIEEKLLQANERVHFDNFGKRGNRTDQLLTRLEEPEITESIQQSDLVLITIGANDIMQVVKENFTNLNYEQFSNEIVHYENRLKTILNRIHALNPHTEIYLIGFYNPFSQYFPEIQELDRIVDDWNNVGKELIENEVSGTFIPTKDLFTETELNVFADDHFHPNEDGYKMIADRVLEYLTEER